MKNFNLVNFVRGWFVGNFDPSIFQTDNFEVGIRRYKAGDTEASHIHRIAEEITVVVTGEVKMNEKVYGENEIIVIEAGDSTDFHAITDAITCVVKVPCAKGDKYLV